MDAKNNECGADEYAGDEAKEVDRTMCRCNTRAVILCWSTPSDSGRSKVGDLVSVLKNYCEILTI